MLSKSTRLSAFILLVSAAPSAAQQPLEITTQWITRGNPASPFGNVVGATHTASGTIVVADGLANVLYRVSANGGKVRVLARTGSGPGEVRGPTLVAPTSDGGFAVYDITKRAVLWFDRQFRASGETRLQGFVQNPKGMAVLNNGRIVLSGGMFDSVHGVHLFSPSGELLRSFEKIPVTQDPTAGIRIAGGPVSATADGGFLFSLSAPHRITRYDSLGNAHAVAADDELLDPIGDDFYHYRNVNGRQIRSPQWWYAQSRFVSEIAGSSILNVVTRRYEGDSIWEIWSSSGQLRSRVVLPIADRPWSVMPDGGVLATFIDSATGESVLAKLRLLGR